MSNAATTADHTSAIAHAMGAKQAISVHAAAIADLIMVETAQTFDRLREAEREALARIASIAPVEYDYERAADYLGVSVPTLERRVANREITFRRDGRRVFFTQSALDQFKAAHTTKRREPRPLPI
jgi:excisionase family DNA binding protein